MTSKKFSNLVAKTLNITHGPEVSVEGVLRAELTKNAFILDEKDGAFAINNLPEWQEVALVRAGFTATLKVAPKRWSSESEKVATYWTAPAN